MEIIDSNAGILSNYEIYQLLCECREIQKIQKPSSRPKALATLIYETLNYFEKTSPCTEYKAESIVDFINSAKQFKLTKAETLQILNLRPTNAVEIQLIVEECEERLTEQQVDDLLNIINLLLPAKTERQGTTEQQQLTASDSNQT